MSSPCEWRVAGLFCAQVYQYLHYKQALPAPFVFVMRIKELVQPAARSINSKRRKPILSSEDTFLQAFQAFARCKADYLEVFENGKFLGILDLLTLTTALMEEYRKEHEKRYQLIKNLGFSLTKIKSIIEKTNAAKTASAKFQLMNKNIQLINSVRKLLK